METTTKYRIASVATTLFLIPVTLPAILCFLTYPVTVFLAVFSKFGQNSAVVDWFYDIPWVGWILANLVVRPLVFAYGFMYDLNDIAVGLWVIGVVCAVIGALTDELPEIAHTGGRKGPLGLYLHAGTRGISMTLGGRVAGGWLSIGKHGIGWRKSKRIF